jgi:hypothetical protein
LLQRALHRLQILEASISPRAAIVDISFGISIRPLPDEVALLSSSVDQAANTSYTIPGFEDFGMLAVA